MHNDMSLVKFVIPGLTRNPAFSRIPTIVGMTPIDVINHPVYRLTTITEN